VSPASYTKSEQGRGANGGENCYNDTIVVDGGEGVLLMDAAGPNCSAIGVRSHGTIIGCADSLKLGALSWNNCRCCRAFAIKGRSQELAQRQRM
jgi:hypothetical protein